MTLQLKHLEAAMLQYPYLTEFTGTIKIAGFDEADDVELVYSLP